MQVNVIDYADGVETLRTCCDLRECFPDSDDEYHAAHAELQRVGRVWVGGGASPVTLLMSA